MQKENLNTQNDQIIKESKWFDNFLNWFEKSTNWLKRNSLMIFCVLLITIVNINNFNKLPKFELNHHTWIPTVIVSVLILILGFLLKQRRMQMLTILILTVVAGLKPASYHSLGMCIGLLVGILIREIVNEAMSNYNPPMLGR